MELSQQNPLEANHNDPSVELKILLEYKKKKFSQIE